MRFASGFEGLKSEMNLKRVGVACVAACLLAAAPMLAQDDSDQRTGVSHPSTAPIAADPNDGVGVAATPPAKPSAAIPATAATGQSTTVYAPYVPYQPAGATANPATGNPGSKAFDPDANIVTEATAGRRALSGPSTDDQDAGIVTYVPSKPGEIPEGTLVRVRLREELSTLTTRPGTKFTAEVSEPVMRDGRVIVPEGSVLEGRVTWVRGGKRIGGSAAIHLEPRTVTLPDGAQYVLRARVIDTSSWQNTKVDDEGTIMRGENTKRNLGVMAMTTGGGAAAGAMIGGPAGALIGAGVGAGVSTVVWLKQDRQAELPKDLGLIFSLTEPMSVTPASAAYAPVKVGASGGQ
jgi:hypothetical protein